MQKGDVTRTFADTQQLQTQFGYKHQTPLLQGIDKLYNWYSGYNGAMGLKAAPFKIYRKEKLHV